MVISLLWALAICSKRKLPVIIDTPLSRLDSNHRTTLVQTYFPNASEQTIILSTDTEIDVLPTPPFWSANVITFFMVEAPKVINKNVCQIHGETKRSESNRHKH